MCSLNEQSKILIQEHYERDYDLNYDGLISEELYKNAKVKILYILKESWGDNKNYSITEDMNKWICKENKPFADNTPSKKMFDRLSEWSYGILNDNYNYYEVKEKLKELHHKPLCEVGYINISKEVTNDTTTSYTKVKQYLKDNANLLKKQIQLFKPDVIITCGVYGEYGIADGIYGLSDKKSDWFDGGANGSAIIEMDNKNIGLISAYHPAAIKSAKDKFNEIMSGWKNIKLKVIKN